jgi:hypothetical protein
MAAPTNAASVKKPLANSEPSTHDPKRTIAAFVTRITALPEPPWQPILAIPLLLVM